VAENASEAVAIVMLNSHLLSHQQPSHSGPGSAKQKIPPIIRPEIKQDVSDEDWSTFVAEWGNFKRCTDIPAGCDADQLFQCCERSLARLLLRENPGIISEGEANLLDAIKQMAVIKVATSVRRTNLLAVKQDHGETIREFYANVKATAATCNYTVHCPNPCCATNPPIDYTSSIVKDVLVAGIADSDIRKDVLGWEELDSKNDKDLVAFVEAKELARNAWNNTPIAGNTAGMSGYKKDTQNPPADNSDKSLKAKLSLKGKCGKCDKLISLYTRYNNGKVNQQPYKVCRKCHKDSKSGNTDVSVNSGSSEADAIALFIGSIEAHSNLSCVSTVEGLPDGPDVITGEPGPMGENNAQDLEAISDESSVNATSQRPAKKHEAVKLHHHIFTPDGWQRATKLTHPTLRLRMTTHSEDYVKFDMPHPKISPKHIDVVVDSGAQSCLWSRRDFLRHGFSSSDLIPVDHMMKAANAVPITIDGAALIRLSGHTNQGQYVEAAVMTYISPDANNFFLSREAMIQLGIVSPDFPTLGSTMNSTSLDSLVATSTIESTGTEPGDSQFAACGCLKRELPPSKPESLPFPCTDENKHAMKSWLLETYASSTFNKCPHQILPAMKGPPIQIHVDSSAKPVALRKPAPVPLHWQDRVEQDLIRDTALGVLERVPHGEPTKWCFRMVVTRKDDGSPRRTVDLSPLNKFCEREAHASKSPFNLARSVPADSVKTVFDAWNGYHSVPIRVEDRHLTTFTTPFGLFRYMRAPQGFLSSGDGYNRRFDDIASHIVRLERCVDDSLLHDTDTETHWWRAIEFIELCGRAGIVLNPEKFQFSEQTVDFAGFRITKETVEPLPKYIEAIKSFPTPENTTDIRSWFGLVNQVSHYAQLRQLMEPFRAFLSPKTKFVWNEELGRVFQESKDKIVEAILEGVQIFDVTRRTCLRTDWSKKGIGYLLAQQHCECKLASYGCCPDGWRITLAGSRFLSPTEMNYAPIEGEALAVAWGLEQTKFFTMGCNNLLVIVDHKPLTKIFGDRRLDEIDNPRLFRMKRRTLMWHFDIEYQRGEKNPFADAMSRHPNKYAERASNSMMSSDDFVEESIVSGLHDEAEQFFAVTWERVQEESKRDVSIKCLIHQISCGFPDSKKDTPTEIHQFWDARDHLTAFEGVVLFKDRIVIPNSLRHRVIENLHSAHQGVSSMFSRAQTIVYWPGMSSDIEEARSRCRTCHRNAPSQAKLPPTAPNLPSTPFQMIFADYLQLKRKLFLITGDRLSGWTEVVKVETGKESSGAKGLCQALRELFVRFGVPEELSSDGGPEFIASETEDFLKRWGVSHRLSSAYYPQSNGRAEVAVKLVKRLLEDNVGEDGSLNTDRFVRALLQQRNTPDRDCELSPAEVLFGRRLRDSLPQLDKSVMIFESGQIHNQWHQAWKAKEEAIRVRLVRSCEQLESKSKELPPLREGDCVFVQNQNKSYGRPNKWDRQGRIIAIKDNDQYLVRVDGSGRLTLRNRRFLRRFEMRPTTVEDAVAYRKDLALPTTDGVSSQGRHVSFNIEDNKQHSGHVPPRSDATPVALQGRMPTIANPPSGLPSRIQPSTPVTNDVPPPQPTSPVHTAGDMPSPGVSSPENPIAVMPAASLPVHPRRSSRTTKQRMCYDATTGGSTSPSAVAEMI